MSTSERDNPRPSRDDLIPGFLVRRLDDNQLEARPLYEVDDIMRGYGVNDCIVASSFGELELLCCAERVKCGIITASLKLVRDTQPWREG
jgi:hypothetical protein